MFINKVIDHRKTVRFGFVTPKSNSKFESFTVLLYATTCTNKAHFLKAVQLQLHDLKQRLSPKRMTKGLIATLVIKPLIRNLNHS